MNINEIKLAVFDFDSTLMDGETFDFFAKDQEMKEKLQTITNFAMQGKIDFFESLTKRVKLLEGYDLEFIDSICQNLPITTGAFDIVAFLKKYGVKVVCFSGGFDNATSVLCPKIGCDAYFSNVLEVRNQKLTGNVTGCMMTNNSKGDMIQKLQALLDVSQEQTLVVGDGANDLSMFKFAKNRVAFCAKEILKQHANFVVEEKNLAKIIQFFV